MQLIDPTPDSYYQADFIEPTGAQQLFEQLLGDRELWAPKEHVAMKYRGNPLQRTKAFLVLGNGEAGQPANQMPSLIQKYYYTGWQWRSLRFYRPFSRVPFVAKLAESLRYASVCVVSVYAFAALSLPLPRILLAGVAGRHSPSTTGCGTSITASSLITRTDSTRSDGTMTKCTTSP